MSPKGLDLKPEQRKTKNKQGNIPRIRFFAEYPVQRDEAYSYY